MAHMPWVKVYFALAVPALLAFCGCTAPTASTKNGPPDFGLIIADTSPDEDGTKMVRPGAFVTSSKAVIGKLDASWTITGISSEFLGFRIPSGESGSSHWQCRPYHLFEPVGQAELQQIKGSRLWPNTRHAIWVGPPFNASYLTSYDKVQIEATFTIFDVMTSEMVRIDLVWEATTTDGQIKIEQVSRSESESTLVD